MFGILWSISFIAILSLQHRVDAFVVQSPFLPTTTSQSWRDPRMTPTVARPELKHLQPSFAKPIGTVTEGFQSSLGKVWSTIFGLLLPFREATVPLVALALSNEWQVNLVKHVLTLISIRFVFSTIVDYNHQTSFRWRKVPRYLLASGLIALGGVWIDSLGVIPYYGINLLKHVATMYVCTQAVRFVQSCRKTTAPSSLKTDRTAVVQSQSVVTPKKSPAPPPPQPVPSPPAPAPPRPSPPPPPTAVEETVVAIAVTEKVDEASKEEETSPPVKDEPPSVDEQPKEDQITLEESEKEKDESSDDSEKKENAVDDSLKEWLYSLANIQEELAEIQLKVIPEIFSKATYDRTQERITKFQMGKILDFFAHDDD